MSIDKDRGTGRTTKQMQEAPKGAIFVWCNGHTDYPRHLARKLGRDDLKIERPSFFEERWRGLRTPIVVDHAAGEHFSDRQWEGWYLWSRIAAALA